MSGGNFRTVNKLIIGGKEMKVSRVKKMLSGALVVALVMAPTLGVSASPSTTNPVATVSAVVSGTAAIAQIPATSSVGGVETTVKGIYIIPNLDGAAVKTSVADIATGYALKSNEKAYAKLMTMDTKKSDKALASLEIGAAALGAEIGPCVNIEFGKMTDGVYSLLSADGAAIRVTLGIPKSFLDETKTYAVIAVRTGGVITICEDVDTNANTITFDTTGGAGAYAIVRY